MSLLTLTAAEAMRMRVERQPLAIVTRNAVTTSLQGCTQCVRCRDFETKQWVCLAPEHLHWHRPPTALEQLRRLVKGMRKFDEAQRNLAAHIADDSWMVEGLSS